MTQEPNSPEPSAQDNIRSEIRKWIDFIWDLGEEYWVIKWIIILCVFSLLGALSHLLDGK